MKKLLLLPLVTGLFFFSACSEKKKADLLVYHATIYTVDSAFSTAEAMVIKDGKIAALGTTADLEKKYDAKEKLDAAGQYIYPGFIDAHAHFVEYGLGLQTVNLIGTNSWEDVLEKVKKIVAANATEKGWITGRGWDQNDWPAINQVSGKADFPDNQRLNELFPDRPVLLGRIDGHAAIANQKALDLAGIKPGVQLTGGIAETKNGRLTGLLIDNAFSMVENIIPSPTPEQLKKALQQAEQNCFATGLTTIDDCGLDYDKVENIKALQENNALKMRLYVMLSDKKENLDWLAGTGTIKTEKLNVRSIKLYADGALGSRGACLLQPYTDKPHETGFLLSDPLHFDSVARLIADKGWQMCTHAIGDSGNRTMLHIYAKYLKGKNDLRWRIEHAQVINQHDFHLFGENNIIPSVQPTHATSDMYWAGDRLGPERIKGAYAYEQLLAENGWIPLGTDFPFEDISPLKTFYAAVIRKDAKGWPEKGFQTVNALTREAAIRGMTIWAAKANFEEDEKGSLEEGKWADFVILDQDLMKAAPENLLGVHVQQTFLGGEKVFQKK